MSSSYKSDEQLRRDAHLKQERLEFKQKERLGRSVQVPLMSTLDFDFEPFSDSGDSGSIYLGTSKKTGTKYLIKHAYSDCACNEFMFHTFGTLLGNSIPAAQLIRLSEGDDRALFDTEYIIAIDYLDGAVQFRSMDQLQGDPGLIEQWIESMGISALLRDEDGAEHMLHDGKLYRVDGTNSFNLSILVTDSLGVLNPEGKNEINHYLAEKMMHGMLIMMKRQGTASYHEALDNACRCVGFDCTEIFLRPFRTAQKLRKRHIDPALNALCEVYPDALAEHYDVYLTFMRRSANAFLKEKGVV